MADPATVKRALHALAYGEFADDETAGPRTVITEADDSLAALDDAARFCDEYGLDSLRAAVRTATARDDHELATRGRTALETVTAYRRAAAGDDGAHSGSADTTSASPDEHFHSARGTTLPGAGQTGDR